MSKHDKYFVQWSLDYSFRMTWVDTFVHYTSPEIPRHDLHKCLDPELVALDFVKTQSNSPESFVWKDGDKVGLVYVNGKYLKTAFVEDMVEN